LISLKVFIHWQTLHRIRNNACSDHYNAMRAHVPQNWVACSQWRHW